MSLLKLEVQAVRKITIESSKKLGMMGSHGKVPLACVELKVYNSCDSLCIVIHMTFDMFTVCSFTKVDTM